KTGAKNELPATFGRTVSMGLASEFKYTIAHNHDHIIYVRSGSLNLCKAKKWEIRGYQKTEKNTTTSYRLSDLADSGGHSPHQFHINQFPVLQSGQRKQVLVWFE